MAGEDRHIELTNALGHRALKYVDAVGRQGYTLTVEELNAYIEEPFARPGTPGTPHAESSRGRSPPSASFSR